MNNIILKGNNVFAYRDPACYYKDGVFYLFYTVAVKEDGYLYEYVGMSESRDLINWGNQRILTPKNLEENYCSPGNVIKYNDEFRICFSSYPIKDTYEKCWCGDENARLYIMRTKDFITFSKPEPIMVKEGVELKDMGRMIDPFILEDRIEEGKYWIFYKQDGINISYSYDMENWTYFGKIDGGENVCVVDTDDGYLMLHSPETGFGIKVSDNLTDWIDKSTIFAKKTDWEWADGRITAAFAMKAPENIKHKYIMFFHGSKKDAIPETHGNASIAYLFTDDFETFDEYD